MKRRVTSIQRRAIDPRDNPGPGSKYVVVPRTAFEEYLIPLGYRHGRAGNETFYERQLVDNPRLWVRVYSSMTEGADVARDIGDDAIRVVLFADNGNDPVTREKRWYPLYKTKKILRTGGVNKVMDRVRDRIQEATDAAPGAVAKYGKLPCAKCGAFTYVDSGKCVFGRCGGYAARPVAQAPVARPAAPSSIARSAPSGETPIVVWIGRTGNGGQIEKIPHQFTGPLALMTAQMFARFALGMAYSATKEYAASADGRVKLAVKGAATLDDVLLATGT